MRHEHGEWAGKYATNAPDGHVRVRGFFSAAAKRREARVHIAAMSSSRSAKRREAYVILQRLGLLYKIL